MKLPKGLRRTVTEFRKGILGSRDSDLMCLAVCSPLQGYLKCLGIETNLVCGTFLGVEHYWLTLTDGTIIDPTQDQFASALFPMPKVYIGPRTECYRDGVPA